MPAPARAADPDWDGDGATATDCRPLDPAVHPAAVDAPDLAFEDSNCDEIDGDAAKAVFVSPAGDDLALGTRAMPVQTIARAVLLAKDTGRDVYAAVGDYAETLSVVGPGFDGFGFYGGYEADTWTRTRAPATWLTGSPEGAVVDGAAGVVIQLARLTGTVLETDAGKSAYGLRAKNARVALEEVTAAAGSGSDGLSRRNQLRPGKPATPLAAGNSTCLLPGLGRDGNAPTGLFKGGKGGNGGDDVGGQPGEPGLQGAALGGEPGEGGTADSVNGKAGSPGSAGVDGTDGDGGSLGVADANGWLGGDGESGTIGANGTGGGGGGGGAGREVGTQRAAGAGGGQGGHGGRGGLSGLGGMAGGGSFGVYLSESSLVAVDSAISAGDGGTGGAGRAGAPGGEGGDGGAGGTAAAGCGVIAGNGGAGGKGGAGGSGGDGGGGAGGPSAAVLREGTTARFANRDSTLTAGAQGAGGAGAGTASGGATPAPENVIGGEQAGDFDGDGHADSTDACPVDPAPEDATGCPARAAVLSDADGDGVPDIGEDADADGVPDVSDACPEVPAGGRDVDADGCPDPLPPDADSDGVPDASDKCPAEAGGSTDANGDGCPDPPPPPPDADSDGVPDASDKCPAQGGGSTDANGDGCPDPPPPPPADTGQGGGTSPQPAPNQIAVLSQPPPAQLAARVSHKATTRGKRTRFDRLVVEDVPAGATVTVTCTGNKCPRKSWTVTAKQTGDVALAAFRKKWMPRGTKLEVTIAKPGAVSRITTYTLRGPKSPKALTRCLPPGATARVSCG